MPAEILPVEFGVVYRHILDFPERVLGGDLRVADFCVPDILEHILAVALESVDTDVPAEHERIGAAVQDEVLRMYAAASPEHLVGVVHRDVLERELLHLAEHLGRIDDGVFHCEVVGVPQGRAASRCKIAVPYGEAVHMPEGVVPDEAAVRRENVGTLLYGGFALVYGHVVDMEAVRCEQRPLASELRIFDQLHVVLFFGSAKIFISFIRSEPICGVLIPFSTPSRPYGRIPASAEGRYQYYVVAEPVGEEPVEVVRAVEAECDLGPAALGDSRVGGHRA